ncbi:MAG: HAMP domain-containing sensor histidine kinase [Candidatus Gracilibacteria bacterium]
MFDILAKKLDVVPIIKGIVKEERVQALQKNITVTLQGDCNKKIFVLADANKIRFVFQNLIANAVKYSKLGGKIVIGCKKTAKDVVFYVKDNGIGISAANQKYIFQKFFRAKNAIGVDTNGTGLGLYIAKAIVEGHKGRIWLKSEENSGTTFYISLPR